MNCASCGRPLPSFKPFWCRKDRVYLCGNCAPRNDVGTRSCLLCAGPVSANLLPAGTFFAVFFVFFLLIIGSLALWDSGQRNSFQATPQVAVSSIHVGDHVRLYGRISGSHDPVLVETYVPGPKNSGHWSWGGSNFRLIDGTASVWINVRSMFGNMYGDAPHYVSPPEEHYYVSGDPIAIVGTVAENASGLVVNAEAAASSPDGFGSGGEHILGVAFAIGSPVSGVVGAYLYVRSRMRDKEHAFRVQQLKDSRRPAPDRLA